VRQRGKETYKLKLTNKDYKYYNGLESDKQVVGPVSVQAITKWRLGECGDKFIGVCMEANSVNKPLIYVFLIIDGIKIGNVTISQTNIDDIWNLYTEKYINSIT
jgi:hypothetical protein